MKPVSLGKKDFVLDVRTADGKPVISIMCSKAVYQRANGSLFIDLEGKRTNLTKLPDGSLALVTTAKTDVQI